MAFRRDAGAAVAVHADFCFRQERFQQHGVGNDADVGAEADDGDFVKAGDVLRQSRCAKGRLFQHDGVLRIGNQRGGQRPAVGRLDAVLDGQFFPFGRLEIIFRVRVLREDQFFPVLDGGLDTFGDAEDDGLRFGRAQGTVDEVVLHINDDESFFHGIQSSFPMEILNRIS